MKKREIPLELEVYQVYKYAKQVVPSNAKQVDHEPFNIFVNEPEDINYVWSETGKLIMATAPSDNEQGFVYLYLDTPDSNGWASTYSNFKTIEE